MPYFPEWMVVRMVEAVVMACLLAPLLAPTAATLTCEAACGERGASCYGNTCLLHLPDYQVLAPAPPPPLLATTRCSVCRRSTGAGPWRCAPPSA